jgi:hypothetical protein
MSFEITEHGKKIYKNKKEQYHRFDGPAIEYVCGQKEWYRNGQRHRLDGPAIIYPNGRKEWFFHGKRHREDGPAVYHPDGYEVWYSHDVLHRLDGPAITFIDGQKIWYVDGIEQLATTNVIEEEEFELTNVINWLKEGF